MRSRRSVTPSTSWAGVLVGHRRRVIAALALLEHSSGSAPARLSLEEMSSARLRAFVRALMRRHRGRSCWPCLPLAGTSPSAAGGRPRYSASSSLPVRVSSSAPSGEPRACLRCGHHPGGEVSTPALDGDRHARTPAYRRRWPTTPEPRESPGRRRCPSPWENFRAPAGLDDHIAGRRRHGGYLHADLERGPSGPLRLGDQRIQLPLPVSGRASTMVRVMSEW